MTPSLSQRLAAEALGSLLLAATVIGSGIMAERLSGGNVALALLANTAATGAALVVLIGVFAPVSGAHFNPAVSLAFVLRRELSARLALLYATVQTAGMISGAWLSHLMFSEPIVQLSSKARDGFGMAAAEFVATFGLLLTILGSTQQPSAIPVRVGLYISAAYWFTASTSFANPAITIARSLTDSFAGITLHSVPTFLVAQFSGAMAATLLCRWLFQEPIPRTGIN